MTQDEIEWSKKLCAHPRFKWMPGMVDAYSGFVYDYDWSDGFDPPEGKLRHPDIAAPSTIGCLIHLIHESMDEDASFGMNIQKGKPISGSWLVKTLLSIWG